MILLNKNVHFYTLKLLGNSFWERYGGVLKIIYVLSFRLGKFRIASPCRENESGIDCFDTVEPNVSTRQRDRNLPNPNVKYINNLTDTFPKKKGRRRIHNRSVVPSSKRKSSSGRLLPRDVTLLVRPERRTNLQLQTYPINLRDFNDLPIVHLVSSVRRSVPLILLVWYRIATPSRFRNSEIRSIA